MNETLIIITNENVEVVNPFTFRCIHCGTEFEMTDVNNICPNKDCKATLFEPMKKSTFKQLFIDSLKAIGIDDVLIDEFLKDHTTLAELGICNELTTIIDRNFQLKFGGQFKSFLVKEYYSYIKDYNFNGD